MLNLHSVYFGQKHPDFDYKDMDIIKRVGRLARKHHRQAENDCNGEGYIKGEFYRCDNEKAYINDETVFYLEGLKIANKIRAIVNNTEKFTVEFQGDPRGNTVKLDYEGDFVDLS